MLRGPLQELRTWWRRRRLLRAYAGVFTARTGKRAGFTPVIAAYARAECDGILSLDGGEVVWYWPEDGENA